jgi:proteasome lid subunit RPN8/RPN11
MPLAPLHLTAAHRDAMLEHVRLAWPQEACGLLGGPPGVVERVYRVENVLHSPVAYYMDPTAQVQAMLELEDAGWDVCGIFHSHPAGPAVPSATDVAQAYYPEAVYVILAPLTPRNPAAWGMRGFEIDNGHVREISLLVTE